MSTSCKLLVIILLMGMLILNIFSIQHRSITTDEPTHYYYGWQICKEHNSDKFNEGIMPWSSLNTIPGMLFKFSTLQDYIQSGRYVTMIFALLLGWYIFKWARQLYGDIGAIFSLLLYTFSPNILAHAGLVTIDLYSTCMMTIALYYFWRFSRDHTWKSALFSMCTLGLAQLTKYSLVFLYGIYVLISVINYLHERNRCKDMNALGVYRRMLIIYFVGIIISSILIINVGFLFNRSGTSFAEYQFKSNFFTFIQSHIGRLQYLPIPLPYPYLEGIDWGMYNDQSGEGNYGNLYLLGKVRKTTPGYRGFIGYYLIACLFKVPLATQLFFLLAVFHYIYILKWNKFTFFAKEIYLLLPVIIYTIFFNIFYKRQIGLRHYLIIFPLIYIFCGSFFQRYYFWGRKKQLLIPESASSAGKLKNTTSKNCF